MEGSMAEQPILERYEPVIGLEVHCQLATHSKLFCACATTFGAAPNHQVCPVCLGLPGVLPVINSRAIDLALRVALAVDAQVETVSLFARKQYFYPDLPKNYQITQFEQPYCRGGGLRLRDGSFVPLRRIHMEEDAGKNVHTGGQSFVDYNRAGVPLIEIVSEPALHSGAAAAEYLRRLRALVRCLQVSDGNLEEGSFRCDANVSLRPRGSQTLGTRCEIKNLNSFRNIEKAITYEILRQADLLDAGEGVEQLTLLWDAAAGVTRAMRSKGDGEDYRYLSEPDLPPLRITAERLARVKESLPELPQAKAERYELVLGLHADQASFLTEEDEVGTYFEGLLGILQVQGVAISARSVANWLLTEFMAAAHAGGWQLSKAPVTPGDVAGLLKLVEEGKISQRTAKEVWHKMIAQGASADAIVKAEGLAQVSDEGTIGQAVQDLFAQYPQQVAEFLAGKEKVYGFLIGRLMQAGAGQFNPALANQLLRGALHARQRQS